MRIEDRLAQPDRLRGDFDHFIVIDIGDGLFQRHDPRRGEADCVILAGRAEVGQLLRLHRVDFKVFRLGVFADDHAFVDLVLRAYEQHAAVFQAVERITHRLACAVGDQHAVRAAFDRTLIGAILFEQAVHDPGAACIGQEFTVIADQAARRGREGDAGLAAARGAHVGHFRLAQGHLVDDRARVLIVHVDHDGFIRLGALAVFVFAEQHARAADAQFKALAAHRFDQHAQLQFAAASHVEAVLVGGFGNADRDIRFRFAHQAIADHAAGHLAAFAARHRAVVHREAHRQGRRIDRLGEQRLGHRRVGNRVGHGRFGEAGQRDDVPGAGFFHRNAF